MYFGKRKYSQLQEFTHFVPSNHLISHGFDSGKRVDSWSCDSFKESRSESESQSWGITATLIRHQFLWHQHPYVGTSILVSTEPCNHGSTQMNIFDDMYSKHPDGYLLVIQPFMITIVRCRT